MLTQCGLVTSRGINSLAPGRPGCHFETAIFNLVLLSGEPDYFGRNKILSGYDLSHYQVPHCIRVFFYFV